MTKIQPYIDGNIFKTNYFAEKSEGPKKRKGSVP